MPGRILSLDRVQRIIWIRFYSHPVRPTRDDSTGALILAPLQQAVSRLAMLHLGAGRD